MSGVFSEAIVEEGEGADAEASAVACVRNEPRHLRNAPPLHVSFVVSSGCCVKKVYHSCLAGYQTICILSISRLTHG